MTDTLLDMKSALLVDECRLTNQLVNQLLVLTLIIMSLGMIFIQFRSFEFSRGWRDLAQVASYLMLVSSTLSRKLLSLEVKLYILVVFMLINGIAGIYTLGFFGSAIFFFALASVFAAMFYQRNSLIAFTVCLAIVLMLAAFSFVRGYSSLENTDALMISPAIWAVYLIGFLYMIIVSSYALFRYRSAHDHLFNMVSQQRDELSSRTEELEQALKEIETLQGIIPICSYCHRIHNEEGAWDRLEVYISRHTSAKFSHGICPPCLVKLKEEDAQEIKPN